MCTRKNVAAIKNHNAFGGWAFLEVVDPWDAKNTIRAFVKDGKQPQAPLLRR